MGTATSIPKIVVGKANKNTPNIYRIHGIPDHLYPYEQPKKARIRFPEIELELALEAFGSLMNRKLNARERIQRLSWSEIDMYRSMLSPVKVLQNALLTDGETRDHEIEIKLDENQLHLCRSSIIELNEIVCKRYTLTIFHVCCNYLRYLPCGIGKLKCLKMLVLSRNRLSEIPEEIGECKELKEIDLSFNLIKTLPRSLVCLKKLNTLQLGSNLFTDIPSFVGKMNSLKYLNVSNNKVRSIPLEIFKLPFLVNLNCTGCTLNAFQRQFTIVGQETLNETVSRHIVRENIAVRKNICDGNAAYILGVQECTFCGGPFFNHYVKVEDMHVFESVVYPVHYRMCCMHYERHENRLPALFERSLATFPGRLAEENLPSVTELFEPRMYAPETIDKIEEICALEPTMPLICLIRHKMSKQRQNTIENFFETDSEHLNVFDHIFDYD